MAHPTFNDKSLQDSNFITESVEYRTIPKRSIDPADVTDRPGVKLLATEFKEKMIRLRGRIIGSSARMDWSGGTEKVCHRSVASLTRATR